MACSVCERVVVSTRTSKPARSIHAVFSRTSEDSGPEVGGKLWETRRMRGDPGMGAFGHSLRVAEGKKLRVRRRKS